MIIDKLKKHNARDIYLFLGEKVLRQARKFQYNKAIINSVCHEKDITRTMDLSECKLFDDDLRLADLYCRHIFDVLGSGPCLLDKDKFPEAAIQAISHFDIAKILVEIKKLNQDYKTIEWNWDFKNNTYFDNFVKSEKINVDPSQIFDIKIPWELARCQHLPFLARIYRATSNQKYKDEIICVILDFILSNPVGYGINWKCTMDVAIRAANWIMALDILSEELDKNVNHIISKSINEHMIFIRYNLEDYRDYRGNHYLSNIVGLIYCCSYFKPTGLVGKLLDFALKQFALAIDEQFYEDGGNFESSIPYHRLSLELVLYGLYRIFTLSETNKLCREYSKLIYDNMHLIKKIKNSMQFMTDGIKPNGNIYQLGDNDSGHLFRFYHFGKFMPADVYALKYNKKLSINEQVWEENELYCGEILSIIQSIDGMASNNIFNELFCKTFEKIRLHSLPASYDNCYYKQTRTIKFDDINLDKIVPFYYPDFGLVGYKGEHFYLGISITGVGQRGRGGHSHNDKLSFELYADGKDLQQDPGTYVYTESLEWRNKFRSVLAHNSPYFGEEQNEIGKNCFELKQRTECRLLEFTNSTITVSCKYMSTYVIRKFLLYKGGLTITDYSKKMFNKKDDFGYFSNGYGKIIGLRRKYDD